MKYFDGFSMGCIRRACAVLGLYAMAAMALPAQPSPAFTITHNFCAISGCPDGAISYGKLVQATNGDFYGTTNEGGASGNYGTVFKITPGGKLTTLYSFCSQTNCTDGFNPSAGLVQASNGKLYGTTVGGGASDSGTIFSITESGKLTTVHSFCSAKDCTDGYYPYAGLIQGTNGDLYGTAAQGGVYGYGTIFKMTPSGTLTTLYSFCAQTNCGDGSKPYVALVQGTNGALYGTAFSGGANNGGTVFKITPSGTLTTLYSFCAQANCTDGTNPYARLIQATDGNLYGTTSAGGAYNGGTVFQITTSGTLTTLYSFCAEANCADGTSPYAGLVEATNGQLYGTTGSGGANTDGTVFQITTSGALTTLYSFCAQSSCADGEFPEAELTQDTNGKLYGTAAFGGAFSGGLVFRLSVGLRPFVETQTTSGKVGAAVKILGTDLTGATRVTFNGAAAAFTVVSSSLITTTVPAGATTGTVEVVTPGGRLSSNVPFRVE